MIAESIQVNLDRMGNFQQTNITVLQLQELLEAINKPGPAIIGTHFECQTCGAYWVLAGIDESFETEKDHPGVWHEEQGHEITSREVTAPNYIADLHQLENAKQLMELARDFMQETVHDLRAVQDSKQRVIATSNPHGKPHFELTDRHARDTSNARYGWDVIGAVLGVSTQAAQSRFSK